MEKDSILNELNNALKQYYSGNGQKGSYNCLFIPVQKADKLLSKNDILIFNLKDGYIFPENSNSLGELKDLAIKTRNIIWEDNLDLVGPVAKKYVRRFPTLEYGDAESEGISGLLKAIKNYDSSLGATFPHYALVVINRSISRNLYKYLRIINLTMDFLPDYKKMEYFLSNFKDKFNHVPSDEELANFMDKPIEYVKNMKEYKEYLYNLTSLNFSTFGKEEELLDTIVDENSLSENDTLNKIILQDFIKDYILRLPDKNRLVLLARLENRTLEDIALHAGEMNIKGTNSKKVLTNERIRQIFVKGITKIQASEEFKKRRLEFKLF